MRNIRLYHVGHNMEETGEGMDTENNGLLCWKCRKIVPYTIKVRHKSRSINGKNYEYNERYGICSVCHSEISVPGLMDENENRFDIIYRRLSGIITKGDIRELLNKYDIEKRPLSHLLGFGEHTISRYLDGQIPKREYSDLLLCLLHDHLEMEKVLEEGKDRITNVAYNKVKKKISLIKQMTSCSTKLELVALYIVNSQYEVTDLSLQKLLYFVKAFSLGVFDEDAVFDDTCEAWAYGPVFPDIYKKYKTFGDSLIPKINPDPSCFAGLKAEDKKIIDFVLNTFGRLNGKVLMDITHKEEPWNTARVGLETFEMSKNVISDSSIGDYYKGINKIYDLTTREGVNKYIDSLFEE